MILKNRRFVEINATIIVGLLIFLTFELQEDPTLYLLEIGEELSDKVKEYEIQRDAIKSTLEKVCPPIYSHLSESVDLSFFEDNEFNTRCLELGFEYSLLQEKIDAGNFKLEAYTMTIAADEFKDGKFSNYLVNVLKHFMIFPFAIAILFELKNYKRNDEKISKPALFSTIFGFVYILVIMGSIGIIYAFSNKPVSLILS